MASQLIVPTRFAEGKPGRRRINNPFARMLKVRKSPSQRRYYGKVWKYPRGETPLRMAPGRKMGKPHGVHIADMVELRKVILLCWRCQPRFFYKKANYYKDLVFVHTTGKCDACKEFDPRAQAYYPEERLAEPSGMLRPGQVLTPR